MGSRLAWDGSIKSRAAGQMRAANSAAAAEIAPSITMGTPCSMPPKNAPAMPAIS